MHRRILSLLLALALLFSLSACRIKLPVPTEPSVTTEPTEPPVSAEAQRYNTARKCIDEASAMLVLASRERTATVGGETFRLASTQTIKLSGIGTEALQAQITEYDMQSLTDNTAFAKYTDYLDGNMLYSKVLNDSEECAFKGETDKDYYLSLFVPGILLDASLYGSVVRDGDVIRFSEPVGAEAWALPEGAAFVSASGTATLDAADTLQESSYEITYTHGTMTVTERFSSKPTALHELALSAPTGEFTVLEGIEGLRLQKRALLYLTQSTSLSSSFSESILSYAAGCIYSTTRQVDCYGQNQNYLSKISHNVNYSDADGNSNYTLTETFRNGKYTCSENDGTERSGTVTAADMQVYTQGFIQEKLVSEHYIEALSFYILGDIYYFEMTYSEDLATVFKEYVNDQLFDNEAFLDDLASAYQTDVCMGYVGINSITGFPVSTGISFAGTHTIGGQKYPLSLLCDQSFYLASADAYEEITGEPLPEEKPKNAATPLLYRVTGKNGDEMYLFGTIHVGDERTAYLPDRFYEIFDGCDSLAVEIDIQAVEDEMENDPAFVEQLADAFYYNDGSTIATHLDKETYTLALQLLKACGGYNLNADYLKPALWQDTFQSFYLQQSYTLLSAKGMDNRLLDRAKEKGMQVLNVEEILPHMTLGVNYSKELQEMLLQSALHGDILGYGSSVTELYEAWCKGDEAAVAKILNEEEDYEGMTEEEIAAYQALIAEYNKAMMFDRNELMLKKAEAYLASGKTVFFAVGLAHLLDDTNGLIDALRDAGYTVELVSYE